jgi:GNAT superfamily N-acetyltransferase
MTTPAVHREGAIGNVTLRPGQVGDGEACGRICYEAFRSLAEEHGFPPDFPSAQIASGLLTPLLSHPGFYSVIAELDGRIVGSNFLDERSMIAGIGPITIDPEVQDLGVGRRLMLDVLDRAQQKRFPGVRLLQAAYHNRSLSLYAKLGFEVREPVLTLQGAPIAQTVAGYSVRPASEQDLEPCNQVCRLVHGHDRSGELLDAIRQGTAQVVEHADRISGYTTGVAFFGHSIGESNEDLKALIGAAAEFGGPGLLLPARNGQLLRWCLERGLRVVQVMTLMSYGLYNEPMGAYLPSVLY